MLRLPGFPHALGPLELIRYRRSLIMSSILSDLYDLTTVTFLYFYALYQYIFLKKSYSSCSAFTGDTWARVQIFSLSLIFKLWAKPHYRSPTFQQDMIDNLSNVAIPGAQLFCYDWQKMCGVISFTVALHGCHATVNVHQQLLTLNYSSLIHRRVLNSPEFIP